MNKIRKAFKALWWILRKPVLLNRVLSDEDTWQSYVVKKHGLPNGLPVVGMDQLIGPGTIQLGPMTYLDGGSLPTDLMLLAGLAERIGNGTYFEIGTWRGESVATVASRASSCFSLCLSDKEMQEQGMQPGTIDAHMQFSKGLPNVTHLRGDSRSFDFRKLNRKFDLIFIDGDHHYEFIKSDTENIFRYLVHDKSMVVWHDYGFFPDRVRFEVLAAILDGVGTERAGQVYHVGHTKCAVFTGEKLHSRTADFQKPPEEYFHTEISRHSLKKDPS